jgi:hypothetical protein
MHPVSNEVPVPTDQIEKKLLEFAHRKFTGRVRLTTRVRPAAALEVEILPPEVTETTRPGDRKLNISPDCFSDDRPTERELIIRREMVVNEYRFRLVMRLISVVCDFKEGTLNSAQWITVG